MSHDQSSHPRRGAAEQIVRHLREAGHVALFNGGCVRDLLLGIEPKDYDVATDAPPQRVQELFKRTRGVGAKFGVVLVRIGRTDTEVATFRSEGAYSDGRRPDTVTYSTPEEDARRRDFTVNGMFYDPLEQRVIDYVGGQADLHARIIRAIGDPEQRFAEDHLRMLRAVRLAARLGFAIDPATLAAIRRHAPHLRLISRERVRMEVELILSDPSRARGWALLRETGLDAHLLPETEWDDSEWSTVLARLSALPADAALRTGLAAVLRRWAPEHVARICHAATFSNEMIRDLTWLLSALSAVLDPDRLELADVKLLRADPRFADSMQLARAEYAASGRSPAPLLRLDERLASLDPATVAPPRLLTGDDLVAWGVPAGPEYAQVLERVYRAQLNETIATRAEALDLARTLIAS